MCIYLNTTTTSSINNNNLLLHLLLSLLLIFLYFPFAVYCSSFVGDRPGLWAHWFCDPSGFRSSDCLPNPKK